MKPRSFVIMLNGSARLVVIGTEEQAREKMEGLAREDFAERVAPFKIYQTFTQYREAVRWRIWDVELLDLRPTFVGVDMASGPCRSTVVSIRTDKPVNERTTRKLLADLEASGHTVIHDLPRVLRVLPNVVRATRPDGPIEWAEGDFTAELSDGTKRNASLFEYLTASGLPEDYCREQSEKAIKLPEGL